MTLPGRGTCRFYYRPLVHPVGRAYMRDPVVSCVEPVCTRASTDIKAPQRAIVWSHGTGNCGVVGRKSYELRRQGPPADPAGTC